MTITIRPTLGTHRIPPSTDRTPAPKWGEQKHEASLPLCSQPEHLCLSPLKAQPAPWSQQATHTQPAAAFLGEGRGVGSTQPSWQPEAGLGQREAMLSRPHRRAAGGGRGCLDHPAGRQGWGQRGGTATSPGSLLPPGTRRWGPNPSAVVQRQPWARGPSLLVGLQQEHGCACATHRPPAGPSSTATEGFFLVPPPPLCFLFCAFVLLSLVLCSSLSFVPTPLVSRPFDALSLPSSWSFSFPRVLKLAVVFCPRSVLGIFILSPASSTLGSHGPGPDCLQNPHLSCVGAGFPCLYVLS